MMMIVSSEDGLKKLELYATYEKYTSQEDVDFYNEIGHKGRTDWEVGKLQKVLEIEDEEFIAYLRRNDDSSVTLSSSPNFDVEDETINFK